MSSYKYKISAYIGTNVLLRLERTFKGKHEIHFADSCLRSGPRHRDSTVGSKPEKNSSKNSVVLLKLANLLISMEGYI